MSRSGARLVGAMAVSIAAHAVVVAVARWAERPPTPVARRAEPVKIRIVERRDLSSADPPQEPARPARLPSAGRGTKDAGARAPRRAESRAEDASAPRRPESRAEGTSTPRRPLPDSDGASAPRTGGAARPADSGDVRYADLFPSAADALPPGAASAPSAASAASSASSSYDPEGASYSFETKARNLARLETFAKELGGRLAVPAAVRRLEPRGKASLRLTRGPTGWTIRSVSGDPYFRAILHDTVAALGPQSYAIATLDASDYATVRIHFTFATASALDETVQPLVTATEANKVFVALTHREAGVGWSLAMPIDRDQGQGPDTVLPNIVGIGAAALGVAMRDDPSEDVEARRLRLSPAFLRPIAPQSR